MPSELNIQRFSFKCVFLFPSVHCNGFIPAVAFYHRQHRSTRLTFNPKPGQVEKHTWIYAGRAHTQNKQTQA